MEETEFDGYIISEIEEEEIEDLFEDEYGFEVLNDVYPTEKNYETDKNIRKISLDIEIFADGSICLSNSNQDLCEITSNLDEIKETINGIRDFFARYLAVRDKNMREA